MYEFLFLDADDTLLDFLKTERAAITESFSRFGLEPTDELIRRYSAINQSCYFFSFFLRLSSRLLISFSPPLESAHSLDHHAGLCLLCKGQAPCFPATMPMDPHDLSATFSFFP